LIATDGASAFRADRESFTGADHGGAAKEATAEENKVRAVQTVTPPALRQLDSKDFEVSMFLFIDSLR
jgi:hypothetical protein